MKTIKYLIIASFLALQVSCVDEKFNDEFKITIDTDLFDQTAVVQVFDPSGQANLEGESVLSVEVLGDDKEKFVTDSGENISTLKVVDGVINLVVNPNKNIEKEPVNVILRVSGDDYLTTTIPVTIDENESAEISAFLVNKTSPIDGVGRVEKTVNITDGVLPETIFLETSMNDELTNKARVTVIAGTQFQDVNNNAILGSELKLELVNFSPTNVDALASFPGGFSPQSVILEDGEEANDIAFVTAGFISIDMFVGDVEVKNFSEPITITMSIDEKSINPETGELVKIGDVIPVWSYSKDDGEWEYHGESEVKEIEGIPQVEYTTTHLSWYNMDFRGRRCSRWSWGGNNGTPVTLSVSLPGVGQNQSHRLLSTFVYAGTNQAVSYYATKTKYWYDGQTFELNNTPAGRNLQLVVYSGSSRYNRGEEVFRSQSFDGCAGGTINIDASSMISKLPPPPVNINVQFSGECNGRIIKPTMYMYMYNETYNYWQYKGRIYRGEIRLSNMELNKPYRFRTYYGGQVIDQTISFDKTEYEYNEFDIPDLLCSQL